MGCRWSCCRRGGGHGEEEKRGDGGGVEEVKEVPVVVLLGICERNGGETIMQQLCIVVVHGLDSLGDLVGFTSTPFLVSVFALIWV